MTSDVVRDFEDIHTVNPIWVQHRIPDTAHMEAETAECCTRDRIKVIEWAADAVHDDGSVPFPN